MGFGPRKCFFRRRKKLALVVFLGVNALRQADLGHAYIALIGLRWPLRGGRPPSALRGASGGPPGACCAQYTPAARVALHAIRLAPVALRAVDAGAVINALVYMYRKQLLLDLVACDPNGINR